MPQPKGSPDPVSRKLSADVPFHQGGDDFGRPPARLLSGPKKAFRRSTGVVKAAGTEVQGSVPGHQLRLGAQEYLAMRRRFDPSSSRSARLVDARFFLPAILRIVQQALRRSIAFLWSTRALVRRAPPAVGPFAFGRFVFTTLVEPAPAGARGRGTA